ncbi:molybdate transport system substrate-binding protein [Thermopolyspora flexuosa]|uniref:Molybdate transport system substrate-binding protein n=2 Tax=Thermopolyspora flexuosa TaxID=103836 RepID=A0A543J0H5_9ACTN|nr:molybdate transport system substrate-binding protein [Thermopolyspora flexuosa]
MFRRLSRWMIAVPVTLALGALSGCGSGGSAGGEREVTVFAAASLTETFTELGRMFEAEHAGTRVRFNFGSSATLAQQIVQGAPADVFAAANPATMKTVTDASLAEQPTTFARNRLQIAVPADNPAQVDELKDLADPNVKVALCAEQVPCGVATVKVLDAAGLKVTPVTLEQDVKATLTKVELGEVDAALVYRTDVIASGGKAKGISFPEAGQAVNDYPIAVLSKASAGDLAERFVDLVLSRRGKDVLAKAGFEVT